MGQAEGNEANVESFKEWLFTGSPASRVDDVIISEEEYIDHCSSESFDIRR